MTPPSPLGATSTGYDADSRPITSTDGKSQTTHITYDNLDRITKETYQDGSSRTYTYDPDGNLLTVLDTATATTTYTYDLKNRLISEVSPGVTNNYTYDGDNNLATLRDAGGTVQYKYDQDDRPVSVQEPNASNPITFAYDPDGRLTCTTYPNGVLVGHTYDTTGQILGTEAVNGTGPTCNTTTGVVAGNSVSRYVYTYNQGSIDTDLRQTMSVGGGTPYSFSYDPLNRLVEENNGGLAQPLYYTYDGNGNITKLTSVNGSITQMTYNAANEICWTYAGTTSAACGSPPSGAHPYTYDGNGQVLTRPDAGGTTALGYNARNQTTSDNPDGTGALTLGYLGTGQNHPTQIGNAPPGGTAPTLENNTLGISSQAAAVPSGGQPSVTYYTRAPDGTLLGQRTPNGNNYYITDANGSIVATTNSTGGTTNSYTYDPWGQCSSQTCPTAGDFGFDGGQLTPGGLYHFGQRYYDPSTGRWTQPDPAVNPTDPTSADPYSFAGDDPINTLDPTGLWEQHVDTSLTLRGWTANLLASTIRTFLVYQFIPVQPWVRIAVVLSGGSKALRDTATDLETCAAFVGPLGKVHLDITGSIHYQGRKIVGGLLVFNTWCVR